MRLVKRGAEGDIFSLDWNGRPSILKTRKVRGYRHPELDKQIRRQRTIHESEIVALVKSFGVQTPLIYFVDVTRCEIIMQHVQGTAVHDLQPKEIVSCSEYIGRITGLLHKNGVMHGDLTTSNFILSGNDLYVFDFGLAIRTEKLADHAVDLRLVKEILNSAHAKIMEEAWTNLIRGYGSVVGSARLDRTLDLVSEIEGRGRYATVV